MRCADAQRLSRFPARADEARRDVVRAGRLFEIGEQRCPVN